MDIRPRGGYSITMLTGIRIYSSDALWQKILSDLNATLTDSPGVADVNFDTLAISGPITPLALKSLILSALDNSDIAKKILGAHRKLPPLQARIVALLYKNGGMSVMDLKNALGYSPGASTHVVDTAIYQLRRTFGHDFIQNKNGMYYIGTV